MAKKQQKLKTEEEQDQPFLFGEMDRIRTILNEEMALLHAEEEKIQKSIRKKGEDLVYIQDRIKKIKKGIDVLPPPSKESMADADEEEPAARVETAEDQDEEEFGDAQEEAAEEEEEEETETDDDLDDEFEDDEDFDDFEDDKD